MLLEIYVYHPDEDIWKKRYTVYPGEEVQIPNITSDGQFEMMRVIVKPDDSMSTVHTILPRELIIRGKLSDPPSQVSFDPKESRNLARKIEKGEYVDVSSTVVIESPEGKKVEEIARARLFHT